LVENNRRDYKPGFFDNPGFLFAPDRVILHQSAEKGQKNPTLPLSQGSFYKKSILKYIFLFTDTNLITRLVQYNDAEIILNREHI